MQLCSRVSPAMPDPGQAQGHALLARRACSRLVRMARRRSGAQSMALGLRLGILRPERYAPAGTRKFQGGRPFPSSLGTPSTHCFALFAPKSRRTARASIPRASNQSVAYLSAMPWSSHALSAGQRRRPARWGTPSGLPARTPTASGWPALRTQPELRTLWHPSPPAWHALAPRCRPP